MNNIERNRYQVHVHIYLILDYVLFTKMKNIIYICRFKCVFNLYTQFRITTVSPVLDFMPAFTCVPYSKENPETNNILVLFCRLFASGFHSRLFAILNWIYTKRFSVNKSRWEERRRSSWNLGAGILLLERLMKARRKLFFILP